MMRLLVRAEMTLLDCTASTSSFSSESSNARLAIQYPPPRPRCIWMS